MATVALRIEKHMRTRVDDLRATPSDVNLLWDANVVCDGVPFNKGRTVSEPHHHLGFRWWCLPYALHILE